MLTRGTAMSACGRHMRAGCLALVPGLSLLLLGNAATQHPAVTVGDDPAPVTQDAGSKKDRDRPGIGATSWATLDAAKIQEMLERRRLAIVKALETPKIASAMDEIEKAPRSLRPGRAQELADAISKGGQAGIAMAFYVSVAIVEAGVDLAKSREPTPPKPSERTGPASGTDAAASSPWQSCLEFRLTRGSLSLIVKVGDCASR